MNGLRPPVFCDYCPVLAVALLDRAPVCEWCLFAAVAREGPAKLVSRIEPLRLAPRRRLRARSRSTEVDQAAADREAGDVRVVAQPELLEDSAAIGFDRAEAEA